MKHFVPLGMIPDDLAKRVLLYPTVRWTAYEILRVRPIASLNFEGWKNTVVSTDGKKTHG